MRTYKSLEGKGDVALQMRESKFRLQTLSEEWCTARLRPKDIVTLAHMGYSSPREVVSIDLEAKTFVCAVLPEKKDTSVQPFYKVSSILLDGIEWKSVSKLAKLHRARNR